MGYIQEFGDKLDGMLGELPEAKRKEVVTFVKNVVLQSYRNGGKGSKTQDGAQNTGK